MNNNTHFFADTPAQIYLRQLAIARQLEAIRNRAPIPFSTPRSSVRATVEALAVTACWIGIFAFSAALLLRLPA